MAKRNRAAQKQRARVRFEFFMRGLKNHPCLDCRKRKPLREMLFYSRDRRRKAGRMTTKAQVVKEILKRDLICKQCRSIRAVRNEKNRKKRPRQGKLFEGS